ncbi:hypothetical protein SAMN05192575_102390 [Nocardioides alpinus]|uniref:DUF2029 domain-containing protein n=1 Tax=Nocardioides alpinus TaxID=748909 RepID=A0A1I0XIJ8_9ACTN|nr:hypothetical protein [Nocardioides alpinus]SFB00048.1 hypothetical protein SAMN05192575_102390 [Nocardioides alpinus]
MRVVATVLVVHLVFVVVRLAAVGGTEGFVVYDGRAYYRLALDPLTLAVSDHGITFTRPAYWQARIGYPLSSWAVSLGGRRALVPAALVLVNLLAVAGIALLAARIATRLGRSAWWGAVPAGWAGFLVGLGQDLTEPLAGLLLLAALLLARSGRHLLAALALTTAGLTRETTLVVAVAVVVAALLPTRGGPGGRTSPPWWVGVVPLVAYAGWRGWVRSRWSDVVPAPPSDNPLGVPGLALVRYLGSALTDPVVEAPHLALLVPTLWALGVAATGLRADGPRHERLALAAYLLLLVSLPVWDRGQAYLRWGCEPLLIGWLLLVGSTRARADRALRALPPLVAVVWLVAATQSVAYPLAEAPWSGWWTWS